MLTFRTAVITLIGSSMLVSAALAEPAAESVALAGARHRRDAVARIWCWFAQYAYTAGYLPTGGQPTPQVGLMHCFGWHNARGWRQDKHMLRPGKGEVPTEVESFDGVRCWQYAPGQGAQAAGDTRRPLNLLAFYLGVGPHGQENSPPTACLANNAQAEGGATVGGRECVGVRWRDGAYEWHGWLAPSLGYALVKAVSDDPTGPARGYTKKRTYWIAERFSRYADGVWLPGTVRFFELWTFRDGQTGWFFLRQFVALKTHVNEPDDRLPFQLTFPVHTPFDGPDSTGPGDYVDGRGIEQIERNFPTAPLPAMLQEEPDPLVARRLGEPAP